MILLTDILKKLFFYLALQTSEPQYYGMITAALTPEQCKSIQEFITTANRRLAEKGNSFLLLTDSRLRIG